jgi:hypothetical protein
VDEIWSLQLRARLNSEVALCVAIVMPRPTAADSGGSLASIDGFDDLVRICYTIQKDKHLDLLLAFFLCDVAAASLARSSSVSSASCCSARFVETYPQATMP